MFTQEEKKEIIKDLINQCKYTLAEYCKENDTASCDIVAANLVLAFNRFIDNLNILKNE